MRSLDEEIARRLQEAAESGELSLAKAYGKPLAEDSGWDATPGALRMPMKILKDAGAVPAEVAWFHERARLRALLDAATDPDSRLSLRQQLSELEQKLALRLEALRSSGSL
ncbi:MAG: DnaJ family domain-containing protein [Betaproteobacteria bacterium]